MKFRIFISSVQDEFAAERRKLKDWLKSDPFVSRFVENVFLFEDVPAKGRAPADVYLDEVKGSDIYIGLIGARYYGRNSVKRGVSATEREYDAAISADIECWIYLSDVPKRDKKTERFVAKGKGRQSRYELKSNRARIAPIAPNSEQVQKSSKNKGKSKFDRSLSPQTTTETAQEMSPQMSPQNISDGATSVLALIRSNDRIKVQEIADALNVSRRTVLRHIKGLSVVGLRFEGPTKKGRWVFGH